MYTVTELQILLKALRRGQAPACPRCLEPMSRSPTQEIRDLPYVRERIWLLCPSCRRSAVLEGHQIDRPG